MITVQDHFRKSLFRILVLFRKNWNYFSFKHKITKFQKIYRSVSVVFWKTWWTISKYESDCQEIITVFGSLNLHQSMEFKTKKDNYFNDKRPNVAFAAHFVMFPIKGISIF